MSRVFRLYKGGAETYEGWNDSPTYPYNSANRDTIEDPDGASARHEITSIPSPFARIDLVKTAFKEVCKPTGRNGKPGLDGDTIFHKMVSDTLDVGEIFFNIDKYKGKIEIITWDAHAMIAELRQDGNVSHFYLADALDKYMKSDARTYNFNDLRNIYLLNYLNGPDELNIIGATSPATLFFSTANKLDYVNDVYFNEDQPFDDDFQPLYKRDFEYIKAWFTLRRTIPNFSTLFPEIETYLNETFKLIADPVKRQELNSVGQITLNDFSAIDVVAAQQNNSVEVLGHNILKKPSEPVTSEFTIKPSPDVAGHLPLVLPVEAGNKYSELIYTSGRWGITNAAPYYDKEKNIEERSLPFDGALCPYLTICDLLEDNLIKVPHTLNTKNYFAGNIQISSPKLSYLIPVKPLLLKYFTVSDLCSDLPNGRKMVEMESLAGGSVKVTLRVPIVGNDRTTSVDYTRIYYNEREPDMRKNEGGIKEFDFAGHIMPLVRFNNPDEAYYSVSCVSTFKREYGLCFYSGATPIQDVSKVCRNEDGAYNYKSVNHTIKGKNIDFIQISDRNGDSGLLIPLLKRQRSINAFEFAIDLGTSNTHIEYKTQLDKNPKAFSYDKNDTLASHIFIPSLFRGKQDDLIDEMPIIEKDFVPVAVGDSDFRFPTRTVLSCAQSIDWNDSQEPYGLYNIPLTYDKRRELQYNNTRYNIKWGRGDDQFAMEAYVDCIILMLRNKVLLNDGDIGKTKITWFYPLSMAPKRVQKLKATWDACYNKYFSNNLATTSMTESVAPIVYYFGRYATATNLINIDMGGGTTDIAFAKNKNVQYVTSFKFATNVLFENSFSELDTNNGIVDWHKNSIFNLLQEKGVSELVAIYNSPNNALPANMASFLFSLKDNSKLKEAGVNAKALDFNSILRDDENFKIVFILYYVSIIYHVANIVKLKEMAEPRHIAFSGNGSKIIKIITADQKLLSSFTKLVFEKVLGRPYKGELEILGLDKDSNPKESTCKGGIIGAQADSSTGNIVIMKGDGSGFVDSEATYMDLNDGYNQRTIDRVAEFFDLTLNTLNREFDFDNSFGVTKESLDIARDICQKDLMTYLDKGIAQHLDESNGKNKIEETTFFYPIKGVLNALSNAINENLKTNNL